jgi:glyoxylase-like metal-dependent hydrolase (beta-lactamase superfamily II)
MTVKTFTFNPVQENTYLIFDETGDAVIIDCGCFYDQEKDTISKYISDNKLTIKRLINTHLHFDHQFGNRYIFETYGIKPEANENDLFLLDGVKAKAKVFGFPIREDAMPIETFLNEGDQVIFGNTTLDCLHIPGHCPGHLVFLDKNNKNLFAGDVLFRGSIGRTDLERGDYQTLINNITKKLLVLPDDITVYPGHGPTTTIGYEKQYNPYL